MKMKILASIMLATMIFSLTACGSNKGAKSSAEKYFEAFESTIKSDNFDLDIVTYEADRSKSFYEQITKYKDGDKIYLGYNDQNFRTQGSDGYYEFTLSDDGFYDVPNDNKIGMKDNDNKYNDEDELSENYIIYKELASVKDGDVNDVMENIALFESSEGIPAYRAYKQAIIEVIKQYEKDNASISFIKNLSLSEDEMSITMYAMDFYMWCDKNIDSYTMSKDMKESASNTEASKITVTIDIKLNKNTVSEYQYYHTIPDNDTNDGIEFTFKNVGQLDDKCNLALLMTNKKKYEKVVSDETKKNAIQFVKDIQEKYPDYRFKIPVNSVYGPNDYSGYYYINVYGYSSSGGGNFGSDEEYNKAYTAEEVLDYLENGTALPEKTLSWKDIYTSFLKKHTSEIATCEIAYLNDDDIPELFTCSEEAPSHGIGAEVYTIKNEEVIKVGTQEYYGSYGSAYIYEKTGIMVSSISGMDGVYSDYYKLNNDSNLEKLCNMHETMAEYINDIKYYIDDVEVQAEEFEAKRKELEPSNVEGRDIPVNGMTPNEMINAIANMQ